MGSRCGVKIDLARRHADLLQQFAGVAMREDAVGRKIVGRIHEVRLRRRRLSRAAHAALGVGNDAVFQIDEPRRDQRLQRQNDRGGVAAGIGNQLRARNLLAMQLRHSVNGLRLRCRGQLRSFVLKAINCAIGRVAQPPRPAQVDHAHSALQRFRHPLARLLMRRGQEQHVDSERGQQFPREWLQLQRRWLRCCRRAADESRRAECRRAPGPSRPRARQRPAACPSGADDAAAAAPAPRRRSPSLPQPLFVLSSSCLQASSLTGCHLACVARVRANHQNRVVAGDRAHHLGPFLAIESRGHRLRAAHHRAPVPPGSSPAARAGQSCQSSPRTTAAGRLPLPALPRLLPLAVGQGIAAGPLGEPQLVNIARKRRLGHLNSAAAQLAAQLVLAGDMRARSALRESR